MKTVIYWFRNDLRLHDQPALQAALTSGAERLVTVYCMPELDSPTRWGCASIGPLRRAWLRDALVDLQQQLQALGHVLQIYALPVTQVLPQLASAIDASAIYCEEIAAPYEQQQVADLRAAGISVHSIWQSSLLDPATLPWPTDSLPASFTPFRLAVEQRRIAPPAALPTPDRLLPPPPPLDSALLAMPACTTLATLAAPYQCTASHDARSSLQGLEAGERAGLAQLQHYLDSSLPAHYKQTRNQLSGRDFSSKWSIWLATGALSARQIYAALKQHEARQGASDGSYWLWFELLWRDYFRFLHLQHGATLYRAGGLSGKPVPPHDNAAFQRWCHGQTGVPLVDAAMRELRHSGYLSNRLRQVVASYWLNEMQGDWRAGAAWFEACLLDYDVYSNQGNWLYLAGRGSDPRGGRHFNIDKQTAEHDADGSYRRLWGVAGI